MKVPKRPVVLGDNSEIAAFRKRLCGDVLADYRTAHIERLLCQQHKAVKFKPIVYLFTHTTSAFLTTAYIICENSRGIEVCPLSII